MFPYFRFLAASNVIEFHVECTSQSAPLSVTFGDPITNDLTPTGTSHLTEVIFNRVPGGFDHHQYCTVSKQKPNPLPSRRSSYLLEVIKYHRHFCSFVCRHRIFQMHRIAMTVTSIHIALQIAPTRIRLSLSHQKLFSTPLSSIGNYFSLNCLLLIS